MLYLDPAPTYQESCQLTHCSLSEAVPASAHPSLGPANSFSSPVDLFNCDVTRTTSDDVLDGTSPFHGGTFFHSMFFHHKVLCFPRTGYGDVPQREHINRGPLSEGSLAVRGEALIHGPSFGRPTRGE